MAIETRDFGTTKDGRTVRHFTMGNKNGVQMSCIEYGCRITNLLVPSKEMGVADVVMGFDTLAEYEADGTFQGAFIGRYGNRIRAGKFTIDGTQYQLPTEDGNNYLHGHLHQRVFEAEVLGDNSISFTYTSPDGEDGFPGELWIGVTYTLTDDNQLIIDYRALSDKDTHVNLTNHSYFNLGGEGCENILGHNLWLNASKFTEVDGELIPTGRTPAVAGGAFDFTKEKPIGQDIDKDDPQLKLGGGYDHNFIIDKAAPGQLAPAAILREPGSNRTMRVHTTLPGVQFYSGNFLEGAAAKNGSSLTKRKALCLETQCFPDTPNQPNFPTTLVKAGEKHHTVTVFAFEW